MLVAHIGLIRIVPIIIKLYCLLYALGVNVRNAVLLPVLGRKTCWQHPRFHPFSFLCQSSKGHTKHRHTVLSSSQRCRHVTQMHCSRLDSSTKGSETCSLPPQTCLQGFYCNPDRPYRVSSYLVPNNALYP